MDEATNRGILHSLPAFSPQYQGLRILVMKRLDFSSVCILNLTHFTMLCLIADPAEKDLITLKEVHQHPLLCSSHTKLSHACFHCRLPRHYRCSCSKLTVCPVSQRYPLLFPVLPTPLLPPPPRLKPQLRQGKTPSRLLPPRLRKRLLLLKLSRA